jgi:hypothetical protein
MVLIIKLLQLVESTMIVSHTEQPFASETQTGYIPGVRLMAVCPDWIGEVCHVQVNGAVPLNTCPVEEPLWQVSHVAFVTVAEIDKAQPFK